MRPQALIKLSSNERTRLKQLLASGKNSARVLTRARILLKADAGPEGPACRDEQIREALEVSRTTIHHLRKRFAAEGLERALYDRPHPNPRAHILDGRGEAKLLALACSKSPEGSSRWTLRLLADKMVELEYAESISHETIRQTLQKSEIKPWLKESWCIPPHANAEFVWRMEDVLDVYERPYDPNRPMVGMDETNKQLLADIVEPLPVAAGHGERYDNQYERCGTSNLFMFFEPLQGQRHVMVTEQRTKIDWAQAIKTMVDEVYPRAEKIVLVMDNLNTHTPGSLYEAFAPEEAKRLADKLEIHYTPKHGSWLNVAEIELSILSRQCLDRRIATKEMLESEVAAWEQKRNAMQAKVNWQFTTTEARIKLKKLYPTIM